MAGLAGGAVRVVFLSQSNPIGWKRGIGLIFVGGLSAGYITPLITQVVGLQPDGAVERGLSFGVGLLAMTLIDVVLRFGDWLRELWGAPVSATTFCCYRQHEVEAAVRAEQARWDEIERMDDPLRRGKAGEVAIAMDTIASKSAAESPPAESTAALDKPSTTVTAAVSDGAANPPVKFVWYSYPVAERDVRLYQLLVVVLCVAGTIAFFVLEESLKPLLDLVRKGWGEYWQIVFGPLLVLIALYARGGIDSLFGSRRHG